MPNALVLSAIETQGNGTFATPHGEYVKCSNYVEQGVCNWMVPSGAGNGLCQACGLNRIIPTLTPENRALWAEVETAKRRLIYGLDRLHLPVKSKHDDEENGLAFDIKSDTPQARVLTGHDDGLITINLSEANPAQREQIRMSLRERYRTMLGHFRHEIGHYYWDRLVRGSPSLPRFRELFGDEQSDYGKALTRHYAAKPDPNYAESFVSTYAAAHPWEDFAETFAHYLHVEDTLETAQHFGLTTELPAAPSVAEIDDFEKLMSEWYELTITLNALNRSMGMPDAYPFALSLAVKAKMAFVHDLVRRAR